MPPPSPPQDGADTAVAAPSSSSTTTVDKMTAAAAAGSAAAANTDASGESGANRNRGVSSSNSNSTSNSNESGGGGGGGGGDGAILMGAVTGGGASGASSSVGGIPLQPGEMLYHNNVNDPYERPTSAPPGFIDQEPHQQHIAVDRTHMAEELIFGAYHRQQQQQQQLQQQQFNAAAAAAAYQHHHSYSNPQQLQQQQQNLHGTSSSQSIYSAGYHSHYTAGSNGSRDDGSRNSYVDPITGAVLFSSGGSAGSHNGGRGGGHGSGSSSGNAYSFSHLAAVLGTGLAESVEDATFDRSQSNVDAWFGGGDTAAAAANSNNISLHRHTRHAASRLIGSGNNPSQADNFGVGGGVGHHHNLHPVAGGNMAAAAASRPMSLYGASGNQMQQQQPQQPQGMMGGFPSSLSSPYGESKSHNNVISSSDSDHHAQRGGGGGRSTTPIQMFPGQIAGSGDQGGHGDHHQHRRALPMTKDLGMNVSEPNDGESQFSGKILPGIVSQRMDHNSNNNINSNIIRNSNSFDSDDQVQQQHQLRNDFNDHEEESNNYYGAAPSTLSGKSKEFTPSTFYGGGADGNSNAMNNNNNINRAVSVGTGGGGGGGGGGDAASIASDAVTEVSTRQCEAELAPFLWDVAGVVVGIGGGSVGGRGRRHEQPSRSIAILRASWLRAPEVRAACEAFGILETFRAEFSTRGIYLASFYDIRSAQYAAVELQASLQRLTIMNGGSEGVLVQYCIPLNSSSQFDESQILISDLPDEIDEHSLAPMLASFGGVRSILSQGAGSFLIEFQNVQDARQAVLELDSSQPWGPGVQVEVAGRNPVERKRGRELLSIISRWRHGMGAARGGTNTGSTNANSNSDPRFSAPGYQGRNNPASPASGLGQQEGFGVGVFGGGSGAAYPGGNSGVPRNAQPETQFILGPDGRYTQVLVQNPFSQQRGGQQQHFAQAIDLRQHRQQQVIQGPNGQIYITSVPMVPHQQVYQTLPGFPATVVTSAAYLDGGGGRRGGGATYYNHAVVSDNISVLSGRSHGTHGTHPSHHSSAGGGEDRDNRHLMLDLDTVENGRDSRTSLMVRNIPNKYTQQMLLSEFTENGHGPGVIDFFYLPIDFKNRCNRGYAFINFVDFKDILTFHRRYFGKHWRTFNSDKICDITYARIQGKAAMLKRFENSALMEKDDEYKPLVFVSEGPDKGKRLPFPADPATRTAI